MRPVIVALTSLVLAACGSPEVQLPPGNNNLTSDAASGGELPAPSVAPPPGRYPYAKLALRGSAPNATRIIVEGAGNPTAGQVQPVDNSFCIEVDLAAAPAHYVLEVKSQAGDGRLSPATKVELDRANDAPPPADAKLCDGKPAG